MYYYFDFYHPLLHLPPVGNPAYFGFAPHVDSLAQNLIIKARTQPIFPPIPPAKATPKIQQDQKIITQNHVQTISKNVRIISKKSKRGKLNFIDKRNIIPNNINHILAFVQRKSKSERIIGKIIKKYKKQEQPYNLKAFYSYQSFVKNKLSVHVNAQALQTATTHFDDRTQVFSPDEQLFYNRISRIAIFYYLRNMAPLVTLCSHRLKNTSKQDHLAVQRFLTSLVESLCFQESTNQNLEIKDL